MLDPTSMMVLIGRDFKPHSICLGLFWLRRISKPIRFAECFANDFNFVVMFIVSTPFNTALFVICQITLTDSLSLMIVPSSVMAAAGHLYGIIQYSRGYQSLVSSELVLCFMIPYHTSVTRHHKCYGKPKIEPTLLGACE